MHSCLGISEIRSNIFHFLDSPDEEDDEEARVDWSALVDLACTCRCFYEEATDIIWEEMSSLGPLIRVMPDSLWREDDFMAIELIRPICSGDWDRFDHYGPKIRSFTIGDYFDSDIRPEVLIALASYRPAIRPLPRLKCLEVSTSVSSDKMLPHIPFFLEETLQRLSFRFSNPFPTPVQMGSLLDASVRCCPNLTSLHIPFPVEDHVDAEYFKRGFSLRRFLQSFVHIRNLSIGLCNVNPAIMQVIGNFPRLRCLHLGAFDDLGARRKAISRPYFGDVATLPLFSSKASVLEALTVRCVGHWDLAAPVDIGVLLENLPPSLKRLRVSGVHPADLTRPIRRLQDLTAIDVDYLYGRPEPHKSDTAFLSVILDLPHLQQITLEGLSSTSFTEDWIIRLAGACPHLTTLKIRVDEKTTAESPMTLACLIPISILYTNLTQLTISLRPLPLDVGALDIGHSSSQLQQLNLEGPAPEHPWRVLRCVGVLFPRLRLACGRTSKHGNYDGWKTLNDAFEGYFY